MGVAEVFGRLFFERFEYLFSLFLGQEFLRLAFTLVDETRNTFAAVASFEIERPGAGVAREGGDVVATPVLVGNEYGLGPERLRLGRSRLDEGLQFPNLGCR